MIDQTELTRLKDAARAAWEAERKAYAAWDAALAAAWVAAGAAAGAARAAWESAGGES